MYDATSTKGLLLVELKSLYESLRKKLGSYELYNLLEKCLIEVKLEDSELKIFENHHFENLLIRHIRGLAMQLSRFRPADWNKFLDVVIK